MTKSLHTVWYSSVCTMPRLWDGQPRNFALIPGTSYRHFSCSKTSTVTLSSQPPIQMTPRVSFPGAMWLQLAVVYPTPCTFICSRGVNWDNFVYPYLVIPGTWTVPVPFHLYTYVAFTPTSISYRSSRCMVFSFCNSYQQVQLEPNKVTVCVLFTTPSILPSEIVRKCRARSSCFGQNIWCLIDSSSV